MGATVLIMAAGKGTRMRSQLPKVLHPICGRPLVCWPIEAAKSAGTEKVVVICRPEDGVEGVLPAGVEVALQREADGTGGAVRSAAKFVSGDDDVVVLSGDSPLVTGELIQELLTAHGADQAAATLVTTELADPSGYGRVVRGTDGSFERIVETKISGDASEEELRIEEINTGTYCFRGRSLLDALERLKPANAQRELYLGDVLPDLIAAGERVTVHKRAGSEFALGVNTRADLAQVRAIAQRRVLQESMLAGVTITDPASTAIDVDVEIEADVTVEPYCFIHGDVEIASGAVIGPMTTLIDCTVGERSRVTHSYLEGCEVLSECQVGPFAYLRPDARLGEGAKAGTFVEIKNSNIGAGTKVPHLSYIGDADVGEHTNIGAGNITANYDGRRKHRTVIGNKVRTGVDTALVAPVILGDNSYTGAGSVITEDVPEGALGIARARQSNVEGYSERRRRELPRESMKDSAEKAKERER